MINDTKNQVVQAMPAETVEVLGWKELPNVGDEVIQVKDEYIAKNIYKQENSFTGIRE